MADPQQIDLSAGLVPKASTTVPNQSTGVIDLSAGLVPKPASTENVQRGPEYNDPTKAVQPGFFARAYETSGLKGLVDQAKAKADEDEAVNKEVVSAVKSGRYGHAAETLLSHIAKGAGQAALGPGGEMIKGAATGAYEHGTAAVQAARQGKTGEAVENAAEAVPLLGQVGEAIGKPLGTDIGSGNVAGAAGDIAGAGAQWLAAHGAGKLAGAGAAGEEAATATRTAEETAPKAQPLKAAGETVQKEAAATREAAGKKVGTAKEAVAKSLPAKPSPLLDKNGALKVATDKVLQDTSDAEQLAGAKDPDMADVRAMADHLSKGKNAAGDSLNLDEDHVESMKRAFNQKIDALQTKADAGGNASALRHVKNLKQAWQSDLYDAYEAHGDPASAQALKAASKEYAGIVGDQTSGPARTMFRNQSPEKIVSTIVNSGARSQSAVESLVRNMTDSGKQTLRDSVLKNIYDKNALPDGTIDMAKARKNFYSLGDTAKTLYGSDLKPVTDYLDAASKEQAVRTAKANTPSVVGRIGQRLARVGATAAGAAVGGVPGAVAGEEVASSLFQNGKSGAVKIGISPTERITLSPTQAAASRSLITKFLKAKSAGNPAALAAAYNAIANQKPQQNQ